jgi:hypothetical protein
MNVGVISMDFEVGHYIDGDEYGKGYDGTAEIDCDGHVVHLRVEGFRSKTPDLEVDVLVNPVTKVEVWARELADTIEAAYDREIKDLLDDWSVSIAEKQWEPREAAE